VRRGHERRDPVDCGEIHVRPGVEHLSRELHASGLERDDERCLPQAIAGVGRRAIGQRARYTRGIAGTGGGEQLQVGSGVLCEHAERRRAEGSREQPRREPSQSEHHSNLQKEQREHRRFWTHRRGHAGMV
jgi:hypothetical protein